MLREYIRENLYSLSSFARYLGVGRDLLFHWIKGTRCPSLKNAIMIYEKTDGKITPQDLWKEYLEKNEI